MICLIEIKRSLFIPKRNFVKIIGICQNLGNILEALKINYNVFKKNSLYVNYPKHICKENTFIKNTLSRIQSYLYIYF